MDSTTPHRVYLCTNIRDLLDESHMIPGQYDIDHATLITTASESQSFMQTLFENYEAYRNFTDFRGNPPKPLYLGIKPKYGPEYVYTYYVKDWAFTVQPDNIHICTFKFTHELIVEARKV